MLESSLICELNQFDQTKRVPSYLILRRKLFEDQVEILKLKQTRQAYFTYS